MRSWLMLSHAELRSQLPPGATGYVHFTESLAAAVIQEYTKPGDVVLDPFAGYGTTPRVAVQMGRRAVAVELLDQRASFIRQRLGGAADVITGDARQLRSLVTGPVDLCLTSPPYMTATGHPQNPLTGYATSDGDYHAYLAELAAVFGDVAGLLRPGGYAVLNVANPVTDKTITPLAWDIRERVCEHLALRQDVFLCWDQQPPGISGDYCLVFQKEVGRDPASTA
jgi:DNA modification methylase